MWGVVQGRLSEYETVYQHLRSACGWTRRGLREVCAGFARCRGRVERSRIIASVGSREVAFAHDAGSCASRACARRADMCVSAAVYGESAWKTLLRKSRKRYFDDSQFRSVACGAVQD